MESRFAKALAGAVICFGDHLYQAAPVPHNAVELNEHCCQGIVGERRERLVPESWCTLAPVETPSVGERCRIHLGLARAPPLHAGPLGLELGHGRSRAGIGCM